MRTSPKHPDFPTETEKILGDAGATEIRDAILHLGNLVERDFPLDLAELSLALAALQDEVKAFRKLLRDHERDEIKWLRTLSRGHKVQLERRED
jgi:hypothetical protein